MEELRKGWVDVRSRKVFLSALRRSIRIGGQSLSPDWGWIRDEGCLDPHRRFSRLVRRGVRPARQWSWLALRLLEFDELLGFRYYEILISDSLRRQTRTSLDNAFIGHARIGSP